MVTVEHANTARSMLVKLAGLWEGTTRTGQPYFSGSLNDAAAKVLIVANDRRDEEGGPDWHVFLTPAKQRGPLVLVGELHDRTSKAGEPFLSGYLGAARVLVFVNKLREKATHPSHVLYATPKDPPHRPPQQVPDHSADEQPAV